MGGLMFILMFASPFLVIALFSWLIRRSTGYNPTGQLGKPLLRRDDLDFLHLPDFYSADKRKERESKENPHYDALVEAEWQAKRLEDTPLADDDGEVHSLSDLLDQERHK